MRSTIRQSWSGCVSRSSHTNCSRIINFRIKKWCVFNEYSEYQIRPTRHGRLLYDSCGSDVFATVRCREVRDAENWDGKNGDGAGMENCANCQMKTAWRRTLHSEESDHLRKPRKARKTSRVCEDVRKYSSGSASWRFVLRRAHRSPIENLNEKFGLI